MKEIIPQIDALGRCVVHFARKYCVNLRKIHFSYNVTIKDIHVTWTHFEYIYHIGMTNQTEILRRKKTPSKCNYSFKKNHQF